MSGKRGATWRREPTYPGEDRRSAADPDRWDDLGESKENDIDWFATRAVPQLGEGGRKEGTIAALAGGAARVLSHPQLHPNPTIAGRLRVYSPCS